MNKKVIGAVVAIAAAAAIGRFGPRLHERAMAKCREMMSAQARCQCGAA